MTVIYYLLHHHIGNPWLAISHANNHGYDQCNCTHIHTARPLWPGYKWDQLNSRNSGDISISISISTWVLIKIKVSGASYNHRSIANPPGSQRCQSQYLETWREPGPSQAGLTIAEQSRSNHESRINREPIADFIDSFWKLNWSGLLNFELVVLILLCYWPSLLNTVSRQTRIQYKAEM